MKISGVLFTIVLVVSPNQTPAEDNKDPLLGLLEAPQISLATFGTAGCVSSISELLGGQTQHTTSLVQNRHDRSTANERHTVQSRAVSVVFYEIADQRRCVLGQVDITGAQAVVKLPISIGSSRQAVIAKIGQPSTEYPGVDFYLVENEIGADDVIVRYINGKVKSITWFYFID